MTNDERERHIKDCAWLMERAWDRWEKHGCFASRGEADRWRILMEQAIQARDPEYVRRIEQSRGIA